MNTNTYIVTVELNFECENKCIFKENLDRYVTFGLGRFALLARNFLFFRYKIVVITVSYVMLDLFLLTSYVYIQLARTLRFGGKRYTRLGDDM